MISSCCGPPLYSVDVSDELGHRVRLGEGLEKAWHVPGSDGYLVELSTFPRRGKTVTVTFPGKAGDAIRFDDQPSGHLTVPNPTPGPYPRWNPPPLPQTQRSGNAAFTMTSLSRPKTRPWIPAENPEMLATFQVTQNGKPTRDWFPVGAVITDASGQVSQLSGIFLPTPQGWQFAVPVNLPEDESGYKLRVEFRLRVPTAQATLAVSAFSTTPPSEGPPTGSVNLTQPAGRSPHLLTIHALMTTQPHNSTLGIQMDCSPPQNDLHFVLRASDSRNKRLGPPALPPDIRTPNPVPGWMSGEHWDGAGPVGIYTGDYTGRDNNADSYDVQLPPGTKNLHLNFGAVESRWVEFTARPS